MSTAGQREAAGHDVIFADSDAELVSVTAARLARALADGSTAIVIATAEHQRGLEEALEAAAIDVGAARTHGVLIELDAAATLARLLTDGVFDPAAFDRVIGALVRGASSRRSVHAFGEMVGLLWEDGRVPEAIELEEAWNRLLDETPAELLCGYASTVVDDHAVANDIRSLCRLHSAVIVNDVFERTWHFGTEPTVSRVARRVATSALRARGLAGHALRDAEILLAELVANAARHARTPFSVSVTVDDDRVLVAVHDDSEALPVVSTPRSDVDVSGRGLHLVGALARRWGIEPLERGKRVWAELHR